STYRSMWKVRIRVEILHTDIMGFRNIVRQASRLCDLPKDQRMRPRVIHIELKVIGEAVVELCDQPLIARVHAAEDICQRPKVAVRSLTWADARRRRVLPVELRRER